MISDESPLVMKVMKSSQDIYGTCSKFQNLKHSNMSACADFSITLQPSIELETPCEKLIKCIGINSVQCKIWMACEYDRKFIGQKTILVKNALLC